MAYFSYRTVVDAAGSPVPLAPPGIVGRCLIWALSSNTGKIFLGGEPFLEWANGNIVSNGPVASGNQEGFPLDPDERFGSTQFMLRAEKLWLDAETSGEGVSFLVLDDANA